MTKVPKYWSEAKRYLSKKTIKVSTFNFVLKNLTNGIR